MKAIGFSSLACAVSVAVLLVSPVSPTGISESDMVSATATITEDTVWRAEDGIRIVDTLTISRYATLTIEPGVIVKFSSSTSRIDVQGRLVANGEPGQEVYFTSLFDEVGLSAEAEDPGAAPAAGDWTGVLVGSWWDGFHTHYGTIECHHTILRYAGSGGAVAVGGYQGRLTLADCEVAHCGGGGAYGGVVALTDTYVHDCEAWAVRAGTAELTRCNLADCVAGVRLLGGCALTDCTVDGQLRVYLRNRATESLSLVGNTISCPADQPVWINFSEGNLSLSGSDNELGGLRLKTGIALSGFMDDDTVLPAPSSLGASAYVGLPMVRPGRVLTLLEGTVVKLPLAGENGSTVTAEGTIIAAGSPEAKVYFTSILDDDAGGDTNGDERDTAPGPGDWAGIELGFDFYLRRESGSLLADNTVIRYGGHGAPLVHVALGSGTVTDSELCFSEGGGVSGANLTIANSAIHDCASWCVEGKSVTLSNVAVTGENGAVGLAGGACSLTDCTLGDTLYVSSPYATATSVRLLGNEITSAGHPVRVTLGSAGISFSGGYNHFVGPMSGITLGGTLEGSGTLCAPSDLGATAYVGLPIIAEGATLTLSPGTVVKLAPGTQDTYVYGTLVCGQEGDDRKVYITSLDDDYGGDTAGDGSASSADPAHWSELHVGHRAPSSYDDIAGSLRAYNTVFRYGGSQHGIIELACGSVDLAGCEVSDSPTAGVTAQGLVTMTDCTVSRCGTGIAGGRYSRLDLLSSEVAQCGTGISATGFLNMDLCRVGDNANGVLLNTQWAPHIKNNAFSGNAGYGVNNGSSAIVVDATYNWWGDESGPKPPGSGDAVNNTPTETRVLVEPWLGSNPTPFGVPGAPVITAPIMGDWSGPAVNVSWMLAEHDSGEQLGYHVQMADEPGFACLVYDSGGVDSVATECAAVLHRLGPTFLRVRVRTHDGWSAWSVTCKFTAALVRIVGSPDIYLATSLDPGVNSNALFPYEVLADCNLAAKITNYLGETAYLLAPDSTPGRHVLQWAGVVSPTSTWTFDFPGILAPPGQYALVLSAMTPGGLSQSAAVSFRVEW